MGGNAGIGWGRRGFNVHEWASGIPCISCSKACANRVHERSNRDLFLHDLSMVMVMTFFFDHVRTNDTGSEIPTDQRLDYVLKGVEESPMLTT